MVEIGVNRLNVFLLVRVGHFDVPAIRHQIYCDRLSKPLIVNRHGQVENIGDAVLTMTQ